MGTECEQKGLLGVSARATAEDLKYVPTGNLCSPSRVCNAGIRNINLNINQGKLVKCDAGPEDWSLDKLSKRN